MDGKEDFIVIQVIQLKEDLEVVDIYPFFSDMR